MNMLRAVLDTNVVLAAELAANPLSPNKEILRRWRKREFFWLVSEDIAAEYAEKLLERGNSLSSVKEFLEELFILAETVEIQFFHFRHYPVDPDDTVFLLAALNGAATHLVTYDRHLMDVGVFYSEFETCGPTVFLSGVRQVAK